MSEQPPERRISNDTSDGPTAEWFAELADDSDDADPFGQPADRPTVLPAPAPFNQPVPTPDEQTQDPPNQDTPVQDLPASSGAGSTSGEEAAPTPGGSAPNSGVEASGPGVATPAQGFDVPALARDTPAQGLPTASEAPGLGQLALGADPAAEGQPELGQDASTPASGLDVGGLGGLGEVGSGQGEGSGGGRSPFDAPALAQDGPADGGVEEALAALKAAGTGDATPGEGTAAVSGQGALTVTVDEQAAAVLRQAVEPATGPAVAEQAADTVAAAAETPERAQPFAELGMKEEEYQRVRDILGRRPTSAELAIYSVMWSEHCSYKSSRVHLKQFADKAPQTDVLLVGMGENAGVVDVGQGWAVTFKVESHNHPSYVEPYQGAATGVGGIVRDIISMGARPVAVMDSLRFGPADAPDTQRVLPGVVAGIGGYGNSLGLPNIGGEVVFDRCYLQNPLVNALCIGVLKHEDIKRAAAPGPGNKVILFGAGTGPDGIGGASVLASATFDDESQQKRPSVQVGDPFMEKLLIECCLELFQEDLVVGIQDLGAAGVSCATTELAAAGTGGMHVVLDTVPLRDATLRPEEILMSESQERMMAVVSPDKVDRFLEICGRWEIPATAIGEVTDTGRLVMTWRGEVIVDIPPGTAADEGPVYERPYEPPADLGTLQSDTPGRLARPSNADELRKTVLWLTGSPNLASKTWVTSQYDRYVLGNTVLAMPEDAGVIRLDDESGLGVALSLDGNGRYARLDPYAGAQLALSEAYRNVAATGARPLAVTNCLNFGSPEDPGVMWQFARAVEGLADACQVLGVPVTGGNVSFYNQTGTTPINPTPVIGVLGVHDDVRRRTNMALAAEGHMLVLLGETREEFGGSEWAHVVYGHLGGLPPLVDLAAEKALAAVLVAGAREGLLSAAHDVSDGGLSQTLVESCLRGGLGCRITLPGDPFVSLFSESVARALVAVRPGSEGRLGKLCEAAGVPVTQLGVVGGDALTVEGVFTISLPELRETHESLLPSYAT